MDYYNILKISDDCNDEEIKKQYYYLSKIYHPDKFNGDDSEFKRINEAIVMTTIRLMLNAT